MTAKFSIFINAAVQENTPDQQGNAGAAGATTRIGGISESWYSTLTYNSQEMTDMVNEYCKRRARLLPNMCAIVARRFQEVGSRGKVIVSKRSFSGSADTIGDIPQMALAVQSHSRTTGAERKIILGAIPDARVSRGSYVPSNIFQANLISLLDWIQANCLMRAIVQTVPTFPLVQVSDTGIVTTDGVTGFAVDNMVQIMSTRGARYVARGGFFKITKVLDTTSFQLNDWKYGLCLKGKVRLAQKDFEQVNFYDNDRTNPKVTTRKFGRPFDLFRGRASTKQ